MPYRLSAPTAPASPTSSARTITEHHRVWAPPGRCWPRSSGALRVCLSVERDGDCAGSVTGEHAGAIRYADRRLEMVTESQDDPLCKTAKPPRRPIVDLDPIAGGTRHMNPRRVGGSVVQADGLMDGPFRVLEEVKEPPSRIDEGRVDLEQTARKERAEGDQEGLQLGVGRPGGVHDEPNRFLVRVIDGYDVRRGAPRACAYVGPRSESVFEVKEPLELIDDEAVNGRTLGPPRESGEMPRRYRSLDDTVRHFFDSCVMPGRFARCRCAYRVWARRRTTRRTITMGVGQVPGFSAVSRDLSARRH